MKKIMLQNSIFTVITFDYINRSCLNNNVGLFLNEKLGVGMARVIPLILAIRENGTWFLMASDYSMNLEHCTRCRSTLTGS
jgi:hypothetical protein